MAETDKQSMQECWPGYFLVAVLYCLFVLIFTSDRAQAKDLERLPDGRVVLDIHGQKIALTDNPFDRYAFRLYFWPASKDGYDNEVKEWYKYNEIQKFERRHKKYTGDKYRKAKLRRLKHLNLDMRRELRSIEAQLFELLEQPDDFRRIFSQSSPVRVTLYNTTGNRPSGGYETPKRYPPKKFLGKFDRKKVGMFSHFGFGFHEPDRPTEYLKYARKTFKPRKIPNHAILGADGFYELTPNGKNCRHCSSYYLPASDRLSMRNPANFKDQPLLVKCHHGGASSRHCITRMKKNYVTSGGKVIILAISLVWYEEDFPKSTFKKRDLLFRQIVDHIFIDADGVPFR